MLSIKEPFETAGEWYLPENPEYKLAGKMNYDGAGRAELTLNGSFQSPHHNILTSEDFFRYPCIHGIMNNGHAATILDALQRGTTTATASGGSRHSEQITSHCLIIGGPVTSETKYKNFNAHIPGLEIWLSKPSIATDFSDKNSRYTFKIINLPNEEVNVMDGSAKLTFYFGNEVKPNPFQSLNVKINAGIEFEPSQPQSIDWLYAQLAKITFLLTLLSGTSMFASHITAREKADAALSEINILPGLYFKEHCAYSSLHQFFMPRDKLSADFSEIVVKWFALYEKIKTPVNLAVSVLVSKGLWEHVEFLSLMQALEGFHRALFPGDYMLDTDYEKYEKQLVDAIPKEFSPDHRASMKSRLHYGNEISLAKRLNDLSELLSLRSREMLFGKTGKVPRVWVDTRNYYTHWDSELRSQILEGRNLYFANARLRSFLRVLYLAQVGVPSSAIDAALYGLSEEAQFLIQIFNEEKAS